MNSRLLSGAGLAIAVVLFFAVNILAGVGLRHARIDLTENKLYTLSEGSRNVLKSIEEPIRLRFFFSEKLAGEVPQIRIYGSRVRELLEEYAALSNGKIRLEVIDPEPFSDAEDRAVQAGVQGVPLDRSGRAFYFGLTGTNTTDAQETIAFFQQEKEQFLEYDITKLIYNLTSPKKPVIGVLSSLPLEFGPGGMMAAMQGRSQPYAILAQLRQFFDVKVLDSNIDRIEEQIGVLLIAHAQNLQPAAVYAIDQFVMRGGRVVALADPFSETAAAMPDPMGRPQMPGGDHSSPLPDLFASWGVTMDPKVFVADLGLAQRVQASPRQIVDYLAWLSVPAANMANADVVTAEPQTVNLASAGALKPLDNATTSFTPLITSSDRAMLQATEKLQGQPDPAGLLEAFKATGERYVLAARLAGPVKSVFPDGPPPPKEPAGDKKDEKPPLPAHLKESQRPANIIVVADADLIDDRFWLRQQEMFGQRLAIPIAANADLIVNMVDNLAGSGDLIALRSRGRSQRPFDRVEELRREAGQQFLAREKALQRELEETEKKISELQGKNQSGSNALLSAEEQAAIDSFRQQLVKTRQELRAVQRDLNKDIEALEARVKFVNIGLIPILVGIFALAFAWMRRQRRQRRRFAVQGA